jgi:hypothetical protein
MSPTNKLRDRLLKLHAMLGSSNAGEREAARARLEELLARHKKSWVDLPELLANGGGNIDDDVPAAGTTKAPPPQLPDAPWNEWRGPHGDQVPRHLTQGQMARMLAPFGIRPRVIWPTDRTAGGKSAKELTLGGTSKSALAFGFYEYAP